MDPKISCVVLNWNRVEETERCLKSILTQTVPPDELLLLDNGSDSDINAILFEKYPDVRYYKSETNLGCPAGRNRLAELATGDYILFVDNDGVLGKDSISRVRRMLAKRDIDILGGVVYNFSDVSEINYGIEGEDALVYGSLFSGGICLIRRDIFQELGGYSTEYKYGGEESFLAKKYLFKFNKLIPIYGGLFLWHKRSLVSRDSVAEKISLLSNSLLTARKLYPRPLLLLYLTYSFIKYVTIKKEISSEQYKNVLKIPIERLRISYLVLVKFIYFRTDVSILYRNYGSKE